MNNKISRKMKTTKNFTKVVCQNCGAEVIIPANESVVVGRIVGEDSGLGTIVMPTKNGSGTQKSAIEKLMDIAKDNPDMMILVKSVAEQIGDDGYIEVDGIVSRWIPSQCLAMQHSKLGFHRSLACKGYDYSWDVLIAKLKRQYRLSEDKDIEGYNDESRWYNVSTAICMATHFIESLKKAIQEMPKHHHGRREYVKLRCSLNKGKGVHTSEQEKLFFPLIGGLDNIQNSKTPKQLYDNVVVFNKIRSTIKWTPKEQAPEFMNAYKAAGSYYTIKDLILFEGCHMKADTTGDTANREGRYNGNKRNFVDTETSLNILEQYVDSFVSHHKVNGFGYEMLGLLRDFLEYNEFNFKETVKNWAAQSQARKEARMANGSRRSRK